MYLIVRRGSGQYRIKKHLRKQPLIFCSLDMKKACILQAFFGAHLFCAPDMVEMVGIEPTSYSAAKKLSTYLVCL